MECRTVIQCAREGRVRGHDEYHENNNTTTTNTVEQSRLFGDQQI